VQPVGDPVRALARRLRALRERHWPDLQITQQQLAGALGARKAVSVPLVSSWESATRPVVPPADRLTDYAAFFATRRSVATMPYKLLDEAELNRDERTARDQLARELLELREAAVRGLSVETQRIRFNRKGYPIGGGPWQFPESETVTMVCAQLPPQLQAGVPYADPDSPDYTELYTFADLDALIELYGYIRALNPTSEVVLRSASALSPNDYTTHLVVLGGVDWNTATKHLMQVLDAPVTQVSRDEDPVGHFEVATGGEPVRHAATLTMEGERRILLDDVAHFFRGPNPFNKTRTVTLCNGMYSRGVLGAVRSLTDPRFRDRNADYISLRFRRGEAFSILTRVRVVNGAVVTPDWTVEETRLHEWPEVNT
jgi:hypothetical protein